MKKLTIHICRHTVIVFFEVLAACFAIAFLVWAGLVWRLSQGPINVDFLTGYIERTWNKHAEGLDVNFGNAELAWKGYRTPFELHVNNVQVNKEDNTPVLAISTIGMEISKRDLLQGRVLPKSIKLFAPALHVTRVEDGSIEFNIQDTSEKEFKDIEKSQADFLRNIFRGLKEDTEQNSIAAGLRKISIEDAVILYEDHVLGASWRAQNLDFIIARGRRGLIGSANFNLNQEDSEPAGFESKVYYDWEKNEGKIVSFVRNVNLSSLTQSSEKLSSLKGINVPLEGEAIFNIDTNNALSGAEFSLSGDKGNLHISELYKEPFDVHDLSIEGSYAGDIRALKIKELKLGFDNSHVTAKGEALFTDKGLETQIYSAVQDIPLDKLNFYWPERIAPKPRAWVLGHLSKGIANKATLDFGAILPLDNSQKIKINKLEGEIDFKGVYVDYFPPLQAVENGMGKARYNQKEFIIDTEGGILKDMDVLKSHIVIDGFIDKKVKIDILASVSGPLKTALKLIEPKPLEYPQSFGIKTDNVVGKVNADVRLQLPLREGVQLKDLKVDIDASMDNVILQDLVMESPLTGGPFKLSLNNNEIKVSGKGYLDGLAADFSWHHNFTKKAEYLNKVEAFFMVDKKVLERFDLPKEFIKSGVAPFTMTHIVGYDKKTIILLDGDITPTYLFLPQIDYEKEEGSPGAIKMTVHMKGDKPYKISDLSLKTPSLEMKGDAVLGQNSLGNIQINKAELNRFQLGKDTDVSLDMVYTKDTGYKVKVTGQRFDIRPFTKKEDSKNKEKENTLQEPSSPLAISMDVGFLVSAENRYVENAKLFLKRSKWKRIEQLDLDANAGKGKIYLRYQPQDKGYSLTFKTDDAGAALQGLDITDAVRGGVINLKAIPNEKGGYRDLVGSVQLSKFRLVNMPILARLLNSMSLTGFQDLLSGKGINFSRMKSDFYWTDETILSNPGKGAKTLLLRDGQTSGASLGLTFEGTIDKQKDIIDLKGTIVPVSGLNKAISNIPLLGDILSGGGDSVFAATYKIKGPIDQPTVTVNPLAALAPGFLRTLFFDGN